MVNKTPLITDKTDERHIVIEHKIRKTDMNDKKSILDNSGSLEVLADLEATLDEVAESNPRIKKEKKNAENATDLKAVLGASLAVNSSMDLEEILRIVLSKAIELMGAERGLVMLLDKNKELQVKSAYNMDQEKMTEEEHKISDSVAQQVIETGKSVYTSDALSDERYSSKQSVVELHLRSIMCVPIKVKDSISGVIYLDNSSDTKMFLKSDLYIFELYAQMVSHAVHNAQMYNSVLQLKQYNDTVISKSPVGIVVLDSEGQIATMNSISLEIFEFNKEEIHTIHGKEVPTNFIKLLPEKEQSRWKFMINSAFTTKEEYTNSRYFHNTGYVEKVLSIKISPISNLTDDDNSLIMTVEDITEKVLMEKYVIMSEKLVAKGEMAASIAHELNNYLAIASNNAELLALNVERGKLDKVKFNSKSIVENVFKIKRFVDNLMDFSKPQTEYISYDIKHLIEDLLFSLRIQPRFKQVHFTIDLGHNIPNLEMDVGQIQQVLMNLLNNAADAIEEKVIKKMEAKESCNREISIISYYDSINEEITVEVSDNGIGMEEDTLQKLFNRHFTTKKNGHGLGLANCKNILEHHHGDLKATSKAGEGSTFTLTLPRFQPKKE